MNSKGNQGWWSFIPFFQDILVCLCYWLIKVTNAAEHYKRITTTFDMYKDDISLLDTKANVGESPEASCRDTLYLKSKYYLKGLLDKFQYCDSNIELFSIAPHLVIALPTLR